MGERCTIPLRMKRIKPESRYWGTKRDLGSIIMKPICIGFSTIDLPAALLTTLISPASVFTICLESCIKNNSCSPPSLSCLSSPPPSRCPNTPPTAHHMITSTTHQSSTVAPFPMASVASPLSLSLSCNYCNCRLILVELVRRAERRSNL